MSTIPTSLSGGCACGAVRYECAAAPLVMLNCHCRDCQRAGGGPFAPLVVVPTESFKLTKGELKFHGSPSEMGGMTQRGFCAACGTPIGGGPDKIPTTFALRPASLDDQSWYTPQLEVWTSDAETWDKLIPELPHFEKYPPQGD